MIARVPKVELIVMHALDEKETRAGLLIEGNERGGIEPLQRQPAGTDFT